MQVISEFALEDTTVVCPSCNSMFATPALVSLPPITTDTIIEADLHRVLPDSAIRASMIAVCPYCQYAWWITAFKAIFFPPKFVPPAADFSHSKKFAQAVLTGRNDKHHSLDLALVALNGCWCARESGQPDENWLKLARQEMEKTLSDDSWQGNRGYYCYLLAEICRQSKDFLNAVRYFNMVDEQSGLPKELVERQRIHAISGDHLPTIMAPHLVKEMFCRSWDIAGQGA